MRSVRARYLVAAGVASDHLGALRRALQHHEPQEASMATFVEVLYIASALRAMSPRAIDRYIDYFGDPSSRHVGGWDSRMTFATRLA